MAPWSRLLRPRASLGSPTPGSFTQIALPTARAWGYNAPASDTASESTSVTAAASRVTAESVKRKDMPEVTWEQEAWMMYEQVGELQYVANAMAGRIGQVVLYVEKDGVRVRLKEGEEDPILALITPQMVERMALNIFVAGAGLFVGLPADKTKATPVAGAKVTEIVPQGTANPKGATWHVFSTVEAKIKDGKFEVNGEKYDVKDCYIQRFWDPHPAYGKQADSPVRSALPVLRKLVGLDQHTSAQIDSRLAGAGVYWIPNQILANPKTPDDDGQPNQFHENPVLNAIMASMILPMQDRSNASSVVPIMLGADAQYIDAIRYDTFATPFDEKTSELEESSIKRLALCLDAPPELLLGMSDANHWGAWLVRDEVVQVHVAPRADLIADAVTTGFYRPILEQQGEKEPERYVVKADVSGLVQRPNRLADASQLFADNAISMEALREAGGFEPEDAPTPQELAIALTLQVATANPQLLDNMPQIYASVTALIDGTPDTGPVTPGEPDPNREPGSLRPANPATVDATQSGEGDTVGEVDTLPQAGPPV